MVREGQPHTSAPRRAPGAAEVSEGWGRPGKRRWREVADSDQGFHLLGWGCQEITVRAKQASRFSPLARHCILHYFMPSSAQSCEVSRYDGSIPVFRVGPLRPEVTQGLAATEGQIPQWDQV